MLPKLHRSALTAMAAWRAGLAEFIAVLLFVYLGAGSVVLSGQFAGEGLDASRVLLIATTHGIAIMVLAYATLNISGGHLNPAVTVAALLTRNISASTASIYVFAQIGGAAAGALLLLATVPYAGETNLGAHSLGAGVTIGMGLATEMALTFGLVFVVFAAAMDPKGWRALAPLAIGLTVMAENLFGMPISGASMNPARSFGPALVAWEWSYHWIYWVGPLVGGAVAGLAYQFAFLRRDEI